MNDSDANYSDWYSWIEKRVCAKSNLYGTLRYFGNTHFSDGLWCGIELDNPLGKNDGMVNNVRYFTCNSNFGIFVPVSKVTKLKESSEGNFETIANLNETFKIDSFLEKHEVESNSVIVNGLTNKNMKTGNKKLSSSGLGSTESLGILSLDLIEGDNSWDDFKLNCSLNNIFPNAQNAKENNSSCFLESAAVSEDNNLCDTIANPKYASTPRVSKKRLVNSENDSDDSLDAKNHVIDKFTFDTHCQEASEFFFDFEKFKNNPNLTSTYKNFSELTAILNNPEVSPILLEKKNFQQSVSLEKTKDFSKKEKLSQNSNEILSKTFELHNSTSSPLSCGKEYENNKDELNVTKIIEDINYKNSNNLEAIFNEKLDVSSKKLNADATFQFQCPMNTSLKLSLEETKDLTFDLKEKETKNLYESDAINKNVLNTTSVMENLKTINFNGNATFELESPLQVLEEITEENLSSNFNECEVMTDVTNKNKLFLEKTFVFDLSTVNEYETTENQNDSFNYKSEFLKETDDIQKISTGLNYRNSICLPPSSCNELQKSARRSSSVSNYPSRNLFKDTKHKSFNNRSSISSLKDIHGKTNVFKKPFSPNSTLKNSKLVLKPHSSINSKENINRAFNKEDTNLPKSTSDGNTNSKASVNTECNKKEVAFKSKLIKPSFQKGNKSEFSKLKSCNPKNCSSKTISNPALPLKNNINCDSFKQTSSITSKICSMTIPVNKIVKNSITQTSAITTKTVHENSVKDHVIKNSKSQLKMQSLENTFISKSDSHDSLQKSTSDSCDSLQNSKTDSHDSLQKSNFPTSSSGKLKIPKRNSLLPSFKDKLPVGVIKPRYSMLQPKNNAILENVEIERSSKTSAVSQKKLAEISLKKSSEVNSSESCSNRRQSIVLPKKIIRQSHSPSNQKPGLKQPLKKGGIPTGLKIPRFSQNIKKSS